MITLDLSQNSEDEHEILARTKEQHEEWANELEQAVANPEDVQLFAPDVFSPVACSRRWVLILPGAPTEGRDIWSNAFQPLINHRQNQGLEVEITYVGWITGQSGEEGVEDIRDYLRDQHENHGARYACLVGGPEIIPWSHQTPNPWGAQWNLPNDWCYCDLTYYWPAHSDWHPELLVGRIPCVNTTEAENYINKLLAYELNPGNGDHSYLNKALYENGTCHCCELVIPHQGDQIDSTLWRELGDPPYFPRDDQVVDALSASHYNFFTVYTDGYIDLYKTMHGGEPDCFFGVDNIDSLWNGNGGYYFFWYATPCYNAALDSTPRTLCEAALCMYPEKGAIIFSGNTGLGLWNNSAYLQCFAWDILFAPSKLKYFYHAGTVEAMSKQRHHVAAIPNLYVRFSHNLFGDPAATIWCPRHMPFSQKPLVAEGSMSPTSCVLLGCEPVPASGSIAITFAMDHATRVRINAYDLAGYLVHDLGDIMAIPGCSTLTWDCSDIPSGTYLIRVQAGNATDQRKVVILR